MKIHLLIACLSYGLIFSQEYITGNIQYKENDKIYPLEGANVFWQDTSLGTSTNGEGFFELEKKPERTLLVISHLGFKTDTLNIKSAKKINHFLTKAPEEKLDGVILSQRRKSIQKSFIETQNILKVSSEELLKAACCNLSESFETNPLIDVNFSDALSGTRQIKMLGLSSPYILISEENMPMVRGASQAYGLTFTPGTWVESIQISKGAGSVTNGFESITGQINSELQKPSLDAPFFLNLYGSINGRYEVNMHTNYKLGDKLSVGLYTHADKRTQKFDNNKDGFLDLPISDQVNIMNRWQYINTEKGWISLLSWRWMKDQKLLGSMDFIPSIHKGKLNYWGSEIDTNRFDSSFKMGYVFPHIPYQSFGFQIAFSNHDQQAYYGIRNYNINQKSFYGNLLFNSIIGNTQNKFKVGINYSYDQYDENVDSFQYQRLDKNIGSFFELTHDNGINFSWIAGARLDHHSNIGTFFTPRLHIRFVPIDDIVIRLSGGAGRKVANIFAENQNLFSTARKINIQSNGGLIYGLNSERAWNYGIGLTKTFNLSNTHQLSAFMDYYITNFKDQVVVDWENFDQISFYNLEGKSIAKSFHIEIDYSYQNLINMRLAFKNYDVKQDYISGYKEKPLLAKNRFFVNIGIESKTTPRGRQWRWDLTFHLVGNQRLVETIRDDLNSYSPIYSIWNFQLSRAFSKKFEIYLGGENIGNFKQINPIIGSDDPFGMNFDSSQIYGPIFGGMIYSGLRIKI
ncbi:MAG: TonB-dependent receptor [Bacteroidota bacterium]|nr:TonB-dependent receptor [Bacteroidota bacterium]